MFMTCFMSQFQYTRILIMAKKHTKKLTILHSNDLHGDFLAEHVDEKLVGGVSLLSGYINKVRREEKNVLYAIAGDMFRGSIIDSEYQGLSTIEIMNMLSPDIVTIGNHETDYGKKVALVIGNEANGVNDELIDESDILVKIPIYGNAESLNAAISSAILMYEIKKYLV